MHKRKVFLVVNELLRGGGQRIVLDEAKELNRDLFDVTIVQCKSNTAFTAENLSAEAAAARVRVIDLHGAKGTTLTEAWRLFQLCRQEKPDIVHTFLPYAGVIGRIVARLAGVRVVLSTQCNLKVAYSPFWFYLDSWTLFLATAWIAVTEGIERSHASSASRYSPEILKAGRTHFTISAGVDLPVFDARMQEASREQTRKELGLIPTQKMVIMVARLIPWKGHEDLVASLAYLPSFVHVCIVGWGPLEETLRTQAETLGVSDRLHLLGARKDVPALLKAADVFAATHNKGTDGTVWMGANIAQMEACAAFVPSMSTDIPYIENLIEDGVTGLLARMNDPKDIARAIMYLCEHPHEAAEYAHEARARVEERYSLRAMLEQYESMYKILTENHP